jgi:hypothetical protein
MRIHKQKEIRNRASAWNLGWFHFAVDTSPVNQTGLCEDTAFPLLRNHPWLITTSHLLRCATDPVGDDEGTRTAPPTVADSVADFPHRIKVRMGVHCLRIILLTRVVLGWLLETRVFRNQRGLMESQSTGRPLYRANVHAWTRTCTRNSAQNTSRICARTAKT